MIVKILSRKSPAAFGQLISYITRPDKAKDNKLPPVITHNLRSDTPEGWRKEFLFNESFRNVHRRDAVICRHEIISFAKEDKEKITEELLRNVANKYIELRGNTGIYLGTIHMHDTENYHIHFITGLEYMTGKSFHITPKELATLKQELQQYQQEKYPELEHSLPSHGKGKEYFSEKEYQYKQRTRRTLIKEEIAQKVQQALSQSTTRTEFTTKLQQLELFHYERKDRLQGIVLEDGTKIRFSRMDIDLERVKNLPIDRTEEQQVLDEIQAIREERSQKDREIEYDDPFLQRM